MNTFIKAKQQYNDCREAERKKIISYLKEEGFEILKERGGRGAKNYTAGKTLESPYDLSNWKWIEAAMDGINYCITLQAFDRDPNTGNRHVLMDRIGVYTYAKYNAEDAYKNMVTTEIDLPMDDEKLKMLVEFLKRDSA